MKRMICKLESLNTAQSFPMQKDCMEIGRDTRCDVSIKDVALSRKSFAIVKVSNQFALAVLSKQPVFVNGEIVGETRVLQNGDEIKVSNYIFRVHISPDDSNFVGERKYSINTSVLTIRFGDILQSNAEVIVSSDDNGISMGGGVSGTILYNGGMEIFNDVQKNVPAQLGDVIVSTAGRLPYKHVFHCITIGDTTGYGDTSENRGVQDYVIRRSVDKCLRMMPMLGIKSIAFPAIGTGTAGFSLEEVATSMTDVITDFLYATNKQYNVEADR